MIDLHTHSTASDGSYTPAALVTYAASCGLTILALTDHDTVAGNAEAAVAAASVHIQFIPGIELDIEWKSGECHLLGYGVQSNCTEFASLLIRLNDDRRKRNEAIVSRMRDAGIAVELAQVETLAGGGTVGRPHFAKFLVEKKKARSVQDAFDRFLARGRPFFVDRTSISLEEGVAAIRIAGGIPVLAHPLSLYVSWGNLPGVIQNFHDRGVVGLEAWHPATRIRDAERLESLAASLGMIITAGSDFHGMTRTDRKLGRTTGEREIADRYFYEGLATVLNKGDLDKLG